MSKKNMWVGTLISSVILFALGWFQAEGANQIGAFYTLSIFLYIAAFRLKDERL